MLASWMLIAAGVFFGMAGQDTNAIVCFVGATIIFELKRKKT